MEQPTAHILVVDDEAGIRDLLKEAVEDQRYVCYTADCGDAALEILRSEPIDLALLDIIMPGMTGLVLFQQIQEQYPDIPVIFITAVDDLDLAVGHIKEGAYDYLLKPLRLGRLKQVIKEALSKHESILEKARRHRTLEEQVSRQVYDLEARAREIGSLNRLIQAELLEKPVQREEIRDDLAGAQGGGQRQARLTPSYSSDVNTDGGMRFLAAELHDDTMSDLSSLAIELAFIKRQASAVSPELESRLEEIRHRLKATDRRLREIVQGLYPPALALQGLAPALTSLYLEIGM